MIDQAGGIVLDFLRVSGGWGVLTLVLGGVIAFLFVKLMAAMGGGAEIAKNDAVVLTGFTASSEARNRLSDASNRSQELATAAQTTLASNVASLATEIRDLRSEQQRLREDLARRWSTQ